VEPLWAFALRLQGTTLNPYPLSAFTGCRAWGRKEAAGFQKGTTHFSSPHGASKHGPDSVFTEVLTEEEFNFFIKKKNLLFYKERDQSRSSSTTSCSHCSSDSFPHLTSEFECVSGHALSTTYHTEPLWLCKRWLPISHDTKPRTPHIQIEICAEK